MPGATARLVVAATSGANGQGGGLYDYVQACPARCGGPCGLVVVWVRGGRRRSCAALRPDKSLSHISR